MPSWDVITVFLASPGDVSHEREVARDVVDLVNRKVAKHHGLHVALYGWEDQPPGYGRPQAQINLHVDEADLFIGMLWRRWGTPSDEEHSSGFEEEYRRACKRREQGEDHPEVWLFFKDVDDGQQTDAGPELLKVLAFRRQVEEAREALYDSFKDEDDWREKLLLLLSEYIAKWQEARRVREPERAPEAPAAAPDTKGEGEEGPSDASRQLVEALEGAREVVQRSDGSERPDLVQAARLLLASFRWVSEMQTAETLDTHELNLLYQFREQLEPLPRERLQLVRSMLTGEGVRPGWFWLVDGKPAIFLGYLATADANADVRRRALETLGDAALLDEVPHELGSLQTDAFLRRVLDDQDTGVRIAALKLAGRHASDDVLELLRGLQEDAKLGGWAVGALARALLQREPDEALQLLTDEPIVAVEMTDELLAVADKFSADAVANFRTHQSPAMRDLALRLDVETGRLNEEHARAALADDDITVRGRALDAMLARGWPVDGEVFDEVVKMQFLPTHRASHRRLRQAMAGSREALEEDANWYLPYGEVAYEALALLDWQTIGGQVRRDLVESFGAFRTESMDRLRQRFGEIGVEKLGHESDYREQQYLRAALSVLRANGTSDDAELVRPLLAHEDQNVREQALDTLRALRPEHAAEEAIRQATSEHERADRRLAAAKMALELAPSVALQLTESADTAVASLAAASIPNEAEDGVARLTEMLRSESAHVREAAARRLAELLEPANLEAVLKTFMEGHYYYNVVVWLDRFLYCPPPFLDQYLAAK